VGTKKIMREMIFGKYELRKSVGKLGPDKGKILKLILKNVL
jgi:hypothetical protein